MDRLSQILSLDLIPNIGYYKLNQRLNGRSPFELFECSINELFEMGFNQQQCLAITQPDQSKIHRAKTWLAGQPNRTIISYYDPQYPQLLKQISSPPLLLFCQGNADLLHRSQIAIVGSRTPTISARENAKKLASQLIEFSLTVTSGLATGIDSYAHLGAISVNGTTIAVLGSGLDNIYPKSNIGLATKILEHGLLVSEFWPDVAPYASNFPRRNRIVSGLSLGVVVVEAAQRSGSLITARLALEQNREVFAVPGMINNPMTQGCHKLINQGAKLITTAADIIDELPFEYVSLAKVQHKISSRLSPQSRLPFDIILDGVDYEITSIDQVVERSGLPIAIVLEHLLSLELTGLIISSSGGYIKITGDS
ncbi:MAG: DNA-protecting protein DprA [Gammaproteobacteria bacterium]|nr:DNA-protecting protein DprA [Gammaproteobacteria bacterium]